MISVLQFGAANAGIFRVERVHMVTPTRLRIMPAMGKSGMKGQRMMRMRQSRPQISMARQPARSRIRREMKPMRRETERSMKRRNLRSRELLEVVPAEIWRYGLKRVRMRESMEKKSVRLENQLRAREMKTRQPCAYHQKNISAIAISLL